MSLKPVIPNVWAGEDWKLTVEHDLFDPEGEFVVVLDVNMPAERVPPKKEKRIAGIIDLEPEAARELASALMVYAFFADKRNREIEEEQRE